MANTIQPKKLLIVNIIDILNRYTDADHTLTQREIEKILEDEYMMKVDRKAVHRNLVDLIECDLIELEYTETTRMVKNRKTGEMEESSVYTDFSIVRDFTEGELRYLIDGVFSSKHIPVKHRDDLIRKIEGLGGKYFKAHAGNITKEAPTAVYSQQLFYTIGLLDDAIQGRKKVKFRYKYFGLDKKPVYSLREDGKPREYIVSPYEMASKNGRYYLICCKDGYDELANYRIDRIVDVEILDEKARPLREFTNAKNLDRYMRDHVFMYAGAGVKCKFRIVQRMISEVMDTFGSDFRIVDIDEAGEDAYMTVVATVNADSMVQYAKSFAPDVYVLEPKEVADRIKSELEETISLYEQGEEYL